MPKLDLESISLVINSLIVKPPKKLDPVTAKEIDTQLQKVVKEEKEARDADKAPKQKFQHVILVSDPNKVIPAGTELVGWVTKIKEDHDTGSILDRIFKAIRQFNLSKKGKKNPAKTVGEGIESAARKFFKAEEIQVLTKEPVRIIFTDNTVPTDTVKPADID